MHIPGETFGGALQDLRATEQGRFLGMDVFMPRSFTTFPAAGSSATIIQDASFYYPRANSSPGADALSQLIYSPRGNSSPGIDSLSHLVYVPRAQSQAIPDAVQSRVFTHPSFPSLYVVSPWSAIGLGTAAQVLTSNGPNSLPTFQAASGGGTAFNDVCNGRLTLTSGSPVTTSDVTGATSIYFTPYGGKYIALWNGSAWIEDTFAEITLAVGTIVNAQAYDIFAYDSSGTVTLETLEWANATVTMTIASPCVVTWTAHGMSTGMSITFTNSGGALPTNVAANTQYWITKVDANTFKISTSLTNMSNATFINATGSQSGTHTGHQPQTRQTTVTLQDGVYCKSSDKTRRYLGSFMTTATTTTEDSAAKRLLWNYYNRLRRELLRLDATATWTYNSPTLRIANAADANRLQLFQGFSEDMVFCQIFAIDNGSASGPGVCVAVGLDSTTTSSAQVAGGAVSTSGGITSVSSTYVAMLSVGYHSLVWLEGTQSGFTTTFTGTSTVNSMPAQSSIFGFLQG